MPKKSLELFALIKSFYKGRIHMYKKHFKSLKKQSVSLLLVAALLTQFSWGNVLRVEAATNVITKLAVTFPMAVEYPGAATSSSANDALATYDDESLQNLPMSITARFSAQLAAHSEKRRTIITL